MEGVHAKRLLMASLLTQLVSCLEDVLSSGARASPAPRGSVGPPRAPGASSPLPRFFFKLGRRHACAESKTTVARYSATWRAMLQPAMRCPYPPT